MSKQSYIYGRHAVSELLRARPQEVRCLYVVGSSRSGWQADLARLAARHRIKVVELSKHAIGDLVGEVNHQGVAAAVAAYGYVELEDLLETKGPNPLLLALDQIQDPQNLGAIIRSAYALGAVGILLPKDRSADITPAVARAAAGATSHLPVARVTNLVRALGQCQEAGFWVVGTVVGAGEALYNVDFAKPTVVVIGSEGKGLRRLVAETCDVLAEIPMPGNLGSLNASVAAGIVLYEALRQRVG